MAFQERVFSGVQPTGNLQLDEALYGAEIVAEMQIAGRLHAGKHPFLKRHAPSPWQTSAIP